MISFWSVMKRVQLLLLPLVFTGAQPQRPRVDGTYQMLICRNGCGATGTDTSRAYIAGWLVLGDTLSPDLQPKLLFDLAPEHFVDRGPLPSNGCFQLDHVVEPPLSYAGNTTSARLHWRYVGESDTISFPLYRSPDAGYAVMLVKSGNTLRGTGHSWGAGTAAIAEPDDSIVAVRAGERDARACYGHTVQRQSSGLTVEGRILSGVDRTSLGQSADVILQAAGFNQFRITDSIGRFQFFFVPAGKYELTVRAFSYHPLRDSIRVSRDTALTVVMPAHCRHDSLAAVRDIALDRVVVLLHSMLAMTPEDAIVQHRYDFEYLDFGDVVHEPFECETQYNRVVFRYFDQRFGRGWRDSVRVRE